ncbi:MAG: coproporphyrinogen III oxidase family protein [Coriobacteriales bacterium]|jgi:coproporphyrinogen III oxidase-like Fe-S oxidoreductase
MLSERLITQGVRTFGGHYLDLKASKRERLPKPTPGQHYMLYMHIPFCERLCPYCSFNRFPFEEEKTRRYFSDLRREMQMLADMGYDFESVYVGGGTPTIMLDELIKTINQARELFSIGDVSCETNPNHLGPEYLEKLEGVVQRMSVGVQSFDDSLLKQMDRYDKYGSAEQVFNAVRGAADSGVFKSLNVDMIYNFPAQTEDMLRHDLDVIKQTHCNQTTFYPLMASPAVEKSLARTVGEVSYEREQRFYQIILSQLVEGENAPFTMSSAWTFDATENDMIDEYIVDYEEYPAIGSGGMTFMDNTLFVNTFSLSQYDARINAGKMSVMGETHFTKRDHMRYRFMMQLFGLRLDKKQWEHDFGCSVAAGLPIEYAFFKMVGAFDKDNDDELTLSYKGKYLLVAMMRQFFVGVNTVRDRARASLPEDERELLFGAGVPCDKAKSFDFDFEG